MAASIAAAAMAGSSPSANAGRMWRATSPHFVVHAEAPKDAALDCAQKPERFDALMRLLTTPRDNGADTRPLDVYLFDSRATLNGAIDMPSPGDGVLHRGRTRRLRGGIDRRMGGGNGATPQPILFHEYAHHLMLGKGVRSAIEVQAEVQAQASDFLVV